ncbi:MAG: DNA adenine methylase [Kofleriaceae bacterium]|nr:DNA adenine methylase [Kofleriaceae bacterium]MCL4224456.1 DNA adenine methylase [Myxococcales bacterium]
MPSPPHPVPYQGSKRKLAAAILAHVPAGTRRLIEPCCGSAALSLAALHAGRVERVHLGDSFAPLVRLWDEIIAAPERVARAYARLWRDQLAEPRAAYDRVRARFNRDGDPARLLYLLARCVKSAVRFNAAGEFNQSPDRRRLGTHPDRMRAGLVGAAALLRGRATTAAADYAVALAAAEPGDVVYLDPPYEGTSGGRDPRYHQGLDRARLIAELTRLRARGVAVIVSLDGRCGDRRYGAALPAELGLCHVELPAGRSTQATLHGGRAETVESLYVSPALAALAAGGCARPTAGVQGDRRGQGDRRRDRDPRGVRLAGADRP